MLFSDSTPYGWTLVLKSSNTKQKEIIGLRSIYSTLCTVIFMLSDIIRVKRKMTLLLHIHCLLIIYILYIVLLYQRSCKSGQRIPFPSFSDSKIQSRYFGLKNTCTYVSLVFNYILGPYYLLIFVFVFLFFSAFLL